MKRFGLLLCLLLILSPLSFSDTLQIAGGSLGTFCPSPSQCNLFSFNVFGNGFTAHGTELFSWSYYIDFGNPATNGGPSPNFISVGGQISSLSGDFFGFSDGTNFTEKGTGSFSFKSLALIGPELYSTWGNSVHFTLPGYGCVDANADLGASLGSRHVEGCGTGIITADYTKFAGIPLYGANSISFVFNPIPEPSTLVLALTGAVAFVARKRSRPEYRKP